MDVTLVRHAEAERVGDDPALTDRGARQTALLAERAMHWRPTALYVSPLARARQTAAALATATSTPSVVVGWLEEIRLPVGPGPGVEVVDAATLATFRERVVSGLRALLAEHGVVPIAPSTEGGAAPRRWAMARAGASDARIVLVGHGMAHAVALEWLLGVESVPWAGYRFQFGNAAFARVRAFELDGSWVFGLVRYNATDHLPRELATL